MNDFYDTFISESSNLLETVEKYRGDTSLKYTFLSTNYYLEISKEIDFSKLNTKEEIPFVLYKRRYEIIDLDIGMLGTKDYCSFFKDNFLFNCIVKALKEDTQIILGHTHPTFSDRIYGPLPSCIFFDDADDLYNLSFVLDDSHLFKYFIDTELYKKYGGDYCEYFTLMRTFKPICNIGAIYNATMDSLGLFELSANGNIEYIKWKYK